MLSKRVRNEYNNELMTEATAETAATAAVATTAPIFFVFSSPRFIKQRVPLLGTLLTP
jgi:hypothetical protein